MAIDLNEFMGVELSDEFTKRALDGRGHQFTTEQRRASAENNVAMQAERGNVLKRANGENAKAEDGLHGDLDPQRLISREMPVHRTMINMSVAGYQIVEIAKLTGYSVGTVSTVLKQPWAREYMVKQAKATVQAEIKALLEQEALPSLQTLITVRDNPTAKSSDRTSAANSLLDRFLGKPTQNITVEEKLPAQMSDEELRRAVESELLAKAN